MATKRWTREDDTKLWAGRSKPTVALADEFDRSNGGIRSRLKHLQNPEHKAYQRLFGVAVAAADVGAGVARAARQNTQTQAKRTKLTKVYLALGL